MRRRIASILLVVGLTTALGAAPAMASHFKGHDPGPFVEPCSQMLDAAAAHAPGKEVLIQLNAAYALCVEPHGPIIK